MRQWKEAGRAGRDDEAELWKRFRGAQDKFFSARSEVFAAKETELRDQRHRQGAAPGRGAGAAAGRPTGARPSPPLRSIQERWEQAGPVPRESRDQLEQGLRKVEDAVKRAEDAQWKRSNPEALARAEATVSQLRTAIESLEGQLAKAQARNDAAAIRKAEEAIEARRSWLAEAERTLAEFSG